MDDGRFRRSPGRRRIGALLVVAALAAGALGATPARRSVPDCIDVWGEARYRGYGYDHIVHINNRCSTTAICDIATNVNPVPERATVLARQAVEVLTFRGSPSREFEPRVDCRLIGPEGS